MIHEAMSKAANYPLTEEQCLWSLQMKANEMGCCYVEVLPVEKASKILGMYGNKVANEHEQWLGKIVVLPNKWFAPDSFWRTRVKNDLVSEAKFQEGENYVYSEFCGRNIVKLTAEMRLIREDKAGIAYSSESMLFNTEPLISFPFRLGDTVVCQPSALKKNDGGSHGGVMTTTVLPVNISMEEILGRMVGDEFVPFLHIVVEKIKETFQLFNKDFKVQGKHYKPYLKYVRGADFLPLKEGCLIVTKYGNEMTKQDARHPLQIKFIHNHKYHDYRLVSENEDILAYTVGNEWVCCPNVVWGKEAGEREVMNYLYDHETKLIFDNKAKKHFKIEGIDGFVLFGAYYDIKTNKGQMVFCLERHLIGRIIKGHDGGVEVCMASDKVAFDIDLKVHYGEFIPPGETEVPGVGLVNVVQCYENGINPLKIDTVVAKNGEGVYFFEQPSFGFISSGWAANGKKPFSFWFTFRERIAAIIKNMNTIQVKGNRVLVKLLQKTTTDSGILLVGKEAITDKAEVVAIGEKVADVCVGDIITYNKLALTLPISWKGEPHYFIRDTEVTAVIT